MSVDLLEQRFRQKGKGYKIPLNELKNILRNVKGLIQGDFNYLADHYLAESPDNQLTFQQAVSILGRFTNDAKKVSQSMQIPINLFLYQSLITYKNNRICLEQINQQSAIDISFNFGRILGQNFQKKLVNAGQYGIINQKQQNVVEKYTYYHWVQSTAHHLVQEEDQEPHAMFFRSLWEFDFSKALHILTKAEQTKHFQEAVVFIPVLNNLSNMDQQIRKEEALVGYFYNRDSFNIELKAQDQNKVIRKSHFFKQYVNISYKVNQFKQSLDFCAEYCKEMVHQLTNPYFQAAAIFLANSQDNRDGTFDEICLMQGISAGDRFSFAKKFLNNVRFEQFRNKLREQAENSSLIDSVLLFGKQRESQVILQRYLDQSNDLQKVAIVSLYLKFSSGRQTKSSTYDKFIKCYEALIELQAEKKYKLVFDKRCLQIQVQKRNRAPTKTFSFDCLRCGQSQITNTLLDKLKVDIKQPKFKGHTHFSKDFRQQIMNCIVCLELLPKCCVCLYPIAVYNGYAEFSLKRKRVEQQKMDVGYANKGQLIQNAVVWCPKCFHGGHHNHMLEWQEKYQKSCPVADCKCKCSF